MDDTVGQGSDESAASQREPVEGATQPAVAGARTGAPDGRPPAATQAPTAEAELRTFLIADIRGYTTYTNEHGADAAAKLAADFAAIVREVVVRHDGFLLELRGDEALAVFVLARRALRAALELQTRFGLDLPRGVGIGLDAGEAIPVEGGYRGSALNLAARLCGQAGPGETLASEAVIHLAAKVDGIGYTDPKTFRLKGLVQPIRAVRVVPEAQGSRRPIRYGREGGLDRRLLAVGGVALVAVLVGGVTIGSGLLGGSRSSPALSAAPAAASSTPTPSLAPGAAAIGVDDLPLTAFLDPGSLGIAEILDEPEGAADAIYGEGALWVLARQPRAIHEIDPQTGATGQPIPLGFEVSSFAVGDGRLFVAEKLGLIHVFDLASRREIATHKFGGFNAGGVDVEFPDPIWDIAYGEGSIWIAGTWDGDLTRMDPTTGDVVAKITTVAPDRWGLANGVAVTDGVVWVLDSWAGQVLSVDPATNGITFRTAVPPGATPIAAGGGAAWVANPVEGSVIRIVPGGAPTTYAVSPGVSSLAFDEAADAVWTASTQGGVATIDALTGEVRQTHLGHALTAIASNADHVIVGIGRSTDEILASLQGRVLRVATTDPFDSIDPAVAPYDLAPELLPPYRQFADATCAPLLQRRADVGGDGLSLEPSVAAAMPELSADGRTYTFTIREGFAFSPPSGKPLTAEAYRYSIERAAALYPMFVEPFPLLDVVGYFDFRDGRADHISGIAVNGDRMAIRLAAPSPTFLERISLPQFCPVPVGTPVVGLTPDDPPIAQAGPYYVADLAPGEALVTLPNPGYPEPSDTGYDAIAWITERSLARAIGRWERGEVDIVLGPGEELQVGSLTDERWGPGSEAAAADDQRLFHRPSLDIDSLAVNPSSESLADQDVRRALALALDRPVLSELWGLPTDEVMPLTMPGLVDRDRWPLDGARVDEARALLAGRSVALRIAWPRAASCPTCPTVRDALQRQLEAVGFDVTIDERDEPLVFANGLDSEYDLAAAWIVLEYPDPAAWMTRLLSEAPERDSTHGRSGFPREWVPPELAAERDRLGELTGKERFEAASALADRVASELVTFSLADRTYPQLISDRVGCITFRAGTPWQDLVAACPR